MNTHKEQAPVLQLTINNKKIDWHAEYIFGHELKKLGGLPPDEPLFLVIEAPWENELILNETRVNLARPGIEAFVSKEKHADTVILTIETPKGKWENAAFHKTLTVDGLIKKIIDKFGFDPKGNYQLKLKGHDEKLEGHRTLGSYHFKDHTCLVFTDLGNGAGNE